MRNCVAMLLSASPADLMLPASIELFHGKAQLVDMVNRQLDDLKTYRVKAYMTCRAAISTKYDFDLTAANRVQTGTESERRDRRFFLTEATVGME